MAAGRHTEAIETLDPVSSKLEEAPDGCVRGESLYRYQSWLFDADLTSMIELRSQHVDARPMSREISDSTTSSMPWVFIDASGLHDETQQGISNNY